MAYTVHEVAALSGVTIKTLYHYQKIGLLMPQRIAENGYRYYGDRELERLQQILFYRELDLPLRAIKTALQNESSRLRCLCEQRALLLARRQRLGVLLNTLEQAIACTEKGEIMDKDKLFAGLNRREWETALQPQNDHLLETYGYAIDTEIADVEALNETAREAREFMAFMAEALRDGVPADGQPVRAAIEKHLAFLQRNLDIDARGFVAQTRFFAQDDFHRRMLEQQQTGLSYYLCFAAEHYANA